MLHQLQITSDTGSRLVAPVSGLGRLGPKHHGLLIGRSTIDGHLYVAESRVTGYVISTYHDFLQRYERYGPIAVIPPINLDSGIAAVRTALNEMSVGGYGSYNLVTNNCESFVNRAISGTSTSYQVIAATVCLAAIGLTVYMFRSGRISLR